MRLQMIPCKFLFLLAYSTLSILPLFAQDTLSSRQTVWHWFTTSSQSETLQVRISFNGKAIFQSSVPIDSVMRSQIVPEPHQRILEFFFKAEPKLFSSDFAVYPFQRIKCNIWEAGCDPNDILLGISFDIPNEILLNSIHIARPRQLARSQLAKGLFIETYPLKVKRPRTITPPGH